MTNKTKDSTAEARARRCISLLIPDGVGVRNFVLGSFMETLAKEHEVHNLHIIPDDLIDRYCGNSNGNVHWHSLLRHRDRPLSHFVRNCLSYAQMYWVDSFAMRLRRNATVRGSWRRKLGVRSAKLVGCLSAGPRRIRWLDRLHAGLIGRSEEVAYYQSQLSEIRPRILLCSHQRPPEILAPVLAAKKLGIPTATFIFSWDNLTSKGRIAAPFDHFLVWSELMRSQLLQFYPDVPPENVHLVGTPQFDIYGDESTLWTRDEFFRRIGADPQRPLICYSGGDATNAPEDPLHVGVLMEHIRTGRIADNPQVLLRPAPVDDGQRYREITEKYPELIVARPQWVHTDPGNWAAVVPTPEDVQFMANLMRYADINVNFGSTMTIDFSIHDKPVVNIAFDVSDDPPFGVSLWDFQTSFEHYQPVIEFGAARFARSAEQLADHVNAYLMDPGLDREGRRKIVELQVGVPIGQSVSRTIKVLDEIAA